MTSEQIDKYESILKQKQAIIAENKHYAYGDNYGIKTAPKVASPDNRISTPLAKGTIIDIVGYSGRPGELKTEYKLIESDEPDNVTEILDEFDEYNCESVENSELLTVSLSLGIAYELWWVSDKLKLPNGLMTPEYKIVENNECVAVYTDSLKPELEKFMRFSNSNESEDNEADIVDIYYPLLSERYRKSDGKWKIDIEGGTVYPYKLVPVIPFRTSIRDVPVFEAQKDLIDAYDAIRSKTQNEIDRFNALIILFPGKVTNEFMRDLSEKAKPYIDGLEQYDAAQFPQYVEKNYSGVSTFYEGQSKSLKDDYHNTIKVPNFMAENFGGGAMALVTMELKLMGMEFLVSDMEIYFRKGLEIRFLMYQDLINASILTVNWDDYEQKIIWKRNLPVDEEGKIRVAAMLQGLGYADAAIQRYIPNAITDADLVEEVEEEDIDLAVPKDIEAATLSGIQITAASEIISQVSAGILTREAGINQLMVFLGLTREQAEMVMGQQIKKVTNDIPKPPVTG